MGVAAEVSALAAGDVALEGRDSKTKAQMWNCSLLVVAMSQPAFLSFAGSLPLLCVVLVPPNPSHCTGEDRSDLSPGQNTGEPEPAQGTSPARKGADVGLLWAFPLPCGERHVCSFLMRYSEGI